jgi:hypothetical protein
MDMSSQSIILHRPRTANYTPDDLLLSFAASNPYCPAVRNGDGALRLRMFGHLYAYDHWQIEHLQGGKDRITVYLKEVEKGA